MNGGDRHEEWEDDYDTLSGFLDDVEDKIEELEEAEEEEEQ